MANIVTTADLSEYSIALRNHGVAATNIAMLERQILILLFGREGALRLVREINTHGVESEKIKELILGDDELFSGLKALLATLICTNLLSQSRILVGRQNAAKRPLGTQSTTLREEADVVQSLSFTARSITFAMNDYLQKEGKNPLDLHVERAILTTRYATNTSGHIPANRPYFMSLLGW